MSCSQIEALLSMASTKAAQLNEDYNVLTNAKNFLSAVSDITDTIVLNAIDLENEYSLIDKIKESAGRTVQKIIQPIEGKEYK